MNPEQEQTKSSFNEEDSNPGEVLIQPSNESEQFSQENSKWKKINISIIFGFILIVAASATALALFLNKKKIEEKPELKNLLNDG